MTETRQNLDDWLRHFSTASADDSREISKSFYQTMTALSGGAIALSIAFVEKLVPAARSPKLTSLLVGSWSCFTASLLIILVAFLLMLRDYRCLGVVVAEAAADAMMRPNVTGSEAAKNLGSFKFSRLPMRLNWVSVATFIAGVICLVWFAAANLP